MKVSWEKLFAYVTDHRFVVVEELPGPQGLFPGYQVINIQTEKGMSPENLSSALISVLGEKPKHGSNEIKARQLRGLMEARAEAGDRLIFMIQCAHLLPLATLLAMKSLSEMFDNFGNMTKISFVLQGDVAILRNKISKNESIDLRTYFLEQ